jgi:hypothetical protein
MKDRIKRMKTELKAIASELKKDKQERNHYRYRTYIEYRSKHIAYCLLRGTPMEKIESKHRDPNDSTHKFVKQQADKIVEKVLKGELYGAEDLRPSRQEPVAVPASSPKRSRFSAICDGLASLWRLG